MVRLRDSKTYNYSCSDAFQFQNGAIESSSNTERMRLTNKFQFQNGAIESASPIVNQTGTAKFQFQNGAIESNQVRFRSCQYPWVSIPKWCDWEN